MIKILHIDTAKTWRGGQQQLLYLVIGLQHKGYHQIVICQPGSVLFERCKQAGIQVVPVKMRGEWDIYAIWGLAKLMADEKIHIVHLHSAHAHTLGLFAAKLAKIKPKVVVSRRVDFRIRRNPVSWFKYRAGVDKIIAVTEGIKQVLVKDGIKEDKIDVVYSGIDLEKFKNVEGIDYLYREFGLSPNKPIIGIISALAPHKDHATFLKAAAIIKTSIPEAQFLIVGEGKLRDTLCRLSRRLYIDDVVIFTGFRDDIPQITSILDVSVLSSCEGEGIPGTIKEAMAVGVPVIATDTGGIPEIIQHEVNGLLVPPRNPRALSDAIIRILNNKALAEQIKIKAKQVVKRFTREAMVEATEVVYNNLVDNT